MTFFQSIWDYFKPDTPQKAESRPKKPPPQTGGYLDDTSEDTHDAFSRKPFAEKLAKSIASRSDEESLVIGIYGLWGEGKTTVLNYIKTELSTNHINSTICILFNPWRYKDDDELLRSFFETLAISLEKNLYDKGQQIGKLLTNYISVLKLIPTYGDVANEAVKKYSENTIEESKKKVSSILKVEKKRVVIFIDDIDRLDKNEIQALFKLIKLTADFPYTCYILSFDEEMASAILGEQYGHAENTTVAGRNFLEKIIQVPLHLPKASREQLRNYFFDNLNNILNDNQIEFSQKEQDDFTNAFFASIELRLTTPRAIKRYINALSFSIPLLKGETNMIDLMLLESMRLFYPELHAFVRNYPEFIIPQVYHKIAWQDELFTKQALSHINKALEKYNVSEKDAALNLLATLFPAYSVEYKTGDLKYDHRRHSLDKWLKEKRVASDEYYPRYFSYSVSDTDMSDIRIEEILINSEKQSVDDISKSILEEVPIEKADSFITKLRAKEDTLDTSLAIKLSKAIARVALFPDPEGNFLGHTPLSQASIFVFKAIRSIPKAEREEVITDIFNNAQPLYFAIRTFYRLRKIRPDDDGILSEEEENKYGKLLIPRIKDDFLKAFEERQGDFIRSYVWIWGKYFPEDINSFFDDFLSKDENIPILLRFYFPSRSFGRNRYDELTEGLEPSIIIKHLKRSYGENLNIEFDFERNELENIKQTELEKAAISQFIKIYNYIQENDEKPNEQ